MAIHPTAIVDPAAKVGVGVEVGPYCIVGPHVTLGEQVRLLSHVVVENRTDIGANTVIYPFASIGHAPQDKKYKGELSTLVIGRNNVIREHVTMNPGTEGGGMVTRVGDNCLFMASSHIAHDCQVGNNVILANNVALAGHVVVGDFALFGGQAAVQQWARIGEGAMVGGLTGVERDVIPFGMVMGDRARLSGLNLRGLERRGASREEIQNLQSAYRMLFATRGTFAERLEEVSVSYAGSPHVTQMLSFIRVKSVLGLCQPELANAA
jgi:UDP-N-acetylglucosamine acyltransferase